MRVLAHLLVRDLRNLSPGASGDGGGAAGLPLVFFLAVAVLYPFAVGADAALLQRTGGGVVWIAALLAAILPLDRLVLPDLDDGTFDQLALRGIAEETILAIRIVAHWLSFAPLILAASLLAVALFSLSWQTMIYLLLSLGAGTPGLAALGVMTAALVAGTRGGPALGGLLFLPLSMPLIIFGAGSLVRHEPAAVVLTASVSLALIAVAPFAGGAAVRAARDQM